MLAKKVVSKPVTMLILFLLIACFSLYTFSKLKISLFPDIESNYMFVFTNYPGAGPKEVEERITKPLERVLNSINGLKKIDSISNKENSSITLEFYKGVNLDTVSNNIRDAIDLVKPLLPKESKVPKLIKSNFLSSRPIISMIVYGNRPLFELLTYAKDNIKSKLEQVDGVSFVSISGGSEKYISVEISLSKLESYDITLTEIASMIKNQNFELSAGDIVNSNIKYLVKVPGKFKTVEDIGNIVVLHKKSNISNFNNLKTIKLSDIAEIKETNKDIESYAEYNGKPSISIELQKQTSANDIQVSNNIIEKLKKIETTLPRDITIKIIKDNADFIRSAIKTVSSSVFIGAALAILVILFFLRNFRATIIIAITMPISILVVFFLMYFLDISLNIMSLSGLSLGVGMLVDSSIVVIDNIYRYRQRGNKLIPSAIIGLQEVTMSIFASTMTNICVFLPMLIFKAELGIIGELFKDFAFVIVISLVASLFVAIFFIPVASSCYIKLYTNLQKPIKNKLIKYFDFLFESIYFSIEVFYIKLLDWTLRYKIIFTLIIIFSFIGSLFSFSFLNISFMPSFSKNTYNLRIELPKGTLIDKTKFYVDKFKEIAIKEIKGYKGISSNAGGSSSNLGGIEIIFPLKEEAKGIIDTPLQTECKLKKYFDFFPSVKFSSKASQSISDSNKPINIKISSNDFDRAREYGNFLSSILQKEIPELLEVSLNISESSPQIDVEIDREKAYFYGISMLKIANELKASINGIIIDKYTKKGIDYDIFLKLKKSDINGLKNLDKIFIKNQEGVKIPISSIARLNKTKSVTSINRENQLAVIRLNAKIDSNTSLLEINKKVKDFALTKIPKVDGITVSFEGEYEDFTKYMIQFAIIILMSIMLVFGIMSAQFESLLRSFIILFTIPLTMIGVILIYFILKETFTIFAAVGIVILVGVAVNTGIVLIDYTYLLVKRGFELRKAILEAGRLRLRAILMSALTSIIGSTPMAFSSGSGNELLRPISITFIGGMITSTFLTLFFIPILFEAVSKKRTMPFSLFRVFIFLFNLLFVKDCKNYKNKNKLEVLKIKKDREKNNKAELKMIEDEKED